MWRLIGWVSHNDKPITSLISLESLNTKESLVDEGLKIWHVTLEEIGPSHSKKVVRHELLSANRPHTMCIIN